MNGPEVPLALYVHMPWCVRKCPYCDFNSHQLKAAAPDPAYIDALIADFDMELPLVAGRRIGTLFFGGGTPSLFAPAQIGRLLHALKQRIDFAADAEITLEANPGTIERGRFAQYRDAGINRVSLGAQSFSARALEALGRIHTPDDTRLAVEELRAAGLSNFNLDLMYALPQQTTLQALADVDEACALRPAHISYYHLTLEPGTVFHARPPALPDEDAAWDMQAAGQRVLAQAGYAQYEVSAYALAGARCRHNLNYWLFGDYVGIGAGAHGKLSLQLPDRVLRTAKPRQPRDYQAAISAATAPVGERTVVAAEQLPFEFMLNALRLNEGFTAEVFRERTGLALDSVASLLERARTRGLLQPLAAVAGAGWAPTALGRRFLTDLQADFLD
ncbi:MAG: radical SAM family heme chaperone HemW [Steroidobacterales bacterium]